MKKTTQPSTNGAQTALEGAKRRDNRPPQAAVPPGGRLAQLSQMINESRRMQAQRKISAEIQKSPVPQAQMKIASQINPAASAVIEPTRSGISGSPASNRTNLPGNLKAGVEQLSGMHAARVQFEHARRESSAISASGPIQARFNIELLFQKEGMRERLFKEGISIDDLEEIQELMEDKKEVGSYLQELEQSMVAWFHKPESEYKYTRALDLALFEHEKLWMLPEGSKSVRSKGNTEKIPAKSSVEPSNKFLGRIEKAKPLKDVGAAVSHGEYAHRIQWYVIWRSALSIGSITPQFLRKLYMILGDQFFEQHVKEYNAQTALNNMWSLWGAVVDVPLSVVNAKHNEGQEPIGEVGFSAPVTLTSHISKGEGELQYSQLRLAILNRRIKRYFQKDPTKDFGRSDLELATMLKGLPTAMEVAKLPEKQQREVLELLRNAEDYSENGKHKPYDFDYDQRNFIAFALCGIPLSS